MDIFDKAKPILDKLIKYGFEAYFVGGCVRDKLLNRTIGDIDIATSALPEEVMSIFPKTVPTGLQHGTVLVIQNSEPYEITTFRTESTYHDFRRPSEVTFVKSIEEDLKRRDFTMNAIAMTTKNEIIDPFNGTIDLYDGLIRCVGEAKERFQEDALRMLRGIRFVSQLDFRLHDETFNAIKSYKHLIENIAIERISVEIEKMLLGKSPKKGIGLLIQTNLVNHLPSLKEYTSQFNDLLDFPIQSLKTIEEIWALILYKCNFDNPEQVLRNWKMSNNRMKQILKVYHLLNETKIKWSNTKLYQVGLTDAIKYERLQCVIDKIDANELNEDLLKTLYNQLPIYSKSDICITGNDLLEWSQLKGGPWLKEVLSEIEFQLVENQLENNQLAIKEWFINWLQK
ncbi:MULTISPECIES: CCA tRNA nucleotidyltransferase [Bacillaceae]|uniref:CCA-adding enzyme n=1 Tax=Gottfriedia luciferensis TaxID=178774 RepID=A0ABX2ZWF3_9BACI|nr:MULTISPECIES: CCA tRNA nucleotidyltransferase [Bacillaceae]ODG93694.1 CCA tRNA nucleotidyltransferase [Gottfriedia luciferensis]PGZ91129.1 CCA tRNA nucleotidyltransferase [Bacillus sp. AFS029533]